MSLKASLTLLASVVISVGTIYYVHNQQEVERQQMHSGVIRDIQRQQYRKQIKSQEIEKSDQK
jgi:protein PET117